MLSSSPTGKHAAGFVKGRSICSCMQHPHLKQSPVKDAARVLHLHHNESARCQTSRCIPKPGKRVITTHRMRNGTKREKCQVGLGACTLLRQGVIISRRMSDKARNTEKV